jgi:hypothetical protein
MSGRADHGIDLGGDPGGLFRIDMVSAAESRAAGPEVAALSLELYVIEPLADVLGHPVHRDIRATGHVIVQANGLALQAGQARGWGHLEINSVRGGGHDLHLHGVSPLG